MNNTIFSKKELERYSRHLIIPEFNIEGQKKLKEASVLVVGSGGLGSPLLLYLAAAGVGHIGIVDFDVVDESNLQRQVLFGVENIGKPKAEAAKDRLNSLNPYVNIEVYNTKITSENALDIMSKYDLVADGTDNFPTRYLINDACVILGIPNIYASIFRFDGQVSVFNYTDKEGNVGPNYRDLFPEPPPPGLVPSCAEGGVIGVLPGIIGSLQANEVIKVIVGIGQPLSGRLFVFDALSFESRTLNVSKNPDLQPITELIDYQEFCGFNHSEEKKHEQQIKEISVKEFSKLIAEGEEYQLIDVRELYEYDIVNIDGELIPLNTIAQASDRIAKDKKVIIHCRSGKRSASAIRTLEKIFNLQNLYNLKGGILAYAREVDTTLPTY